MTSESTAITPTALLTDDLREQVAHDIWAHTLQEPECRRCGPYEPCGDCLRAFYQPAADAVLATVRRAMVLLHNDGPIAGDSGSSTKGET